MSTAELPQEITKLHEAPQQLFEQQNQRHNEETQNNLVAKIWHSKLGRFAAIGTGIVLIGCPAFVKASDWLVDRETTRAAHQFSETVIEDINKHKGQVSKEYLDQFQQDVEEKLPTTFYKQEKSVHMDFNGDNFIGKPKQRHARKPKNVDQKIKRF